MAIRVVLAEDAYLIRESVERLLEREEDMELAWPAWSRASISRGSAPWPAAC